MRIDLPGDKSLSHRAAMLAAVASSESTIHNFNTGADCLSTLSCLRDLGTGTQLHESPHHLSVRIQPRKFESPSQPLNCGNSGSTLRMLTGLLAGRDCPATLIGDLSLLNRPMKRLAEPLRQMGASIRLRDDEYPPVVIESGVKRAIQYRAEIPSAQVKSAILFAGMNFPSTRVIEPIPTRDHTERMLEYFQVHRSREIAGFQYQVPGDPSAAAYFIVYALFHKACEMEFANVLLNPHRIAFIRKLQQAGARIDMVQQTMFQNELVGTIRVSAEQPPLQAINIRKEEVPSLIDEIPVLALLGTVCGITVRGASELRFKESDRIRAIVTNMDNLGVYAEETEDGFDIFPGRIGSEAYVETFNDHRIAMTFALAGADLDNKECVQISFPDFFKTLQLIEGSR